MTINWILAKNASSNKDEKIFGAHEAHGNYVCEKFERNMSNWVKIAESIGI
jgi:hypothetical protein